MKDDGTLEVSIPEEAEEWKDRCLRIAADFDNYKKRLQQTQEILVKNTQKALLEDFFPIIDGLERALQHSDSSQPQLSEGVEMVHLQFLDTLASHGVHPFESVGHPFNPEYHEALDQIYSEEIPAGCIAYEVCRGYTLNEDLLRPAKVIVSSGQK